MCSVASIKSGNTSEGKEVGGGDEVKGSLTVIGCRIDVGKKGIEHMFEDESRAEFTTQGRGRQHTEWIFDFTPCRGMGVDP